MLLYEDRTDIRGAGMAANKKILLIDDERVLHIMLRSVFATHGIDVISAYTGEEGIERVINEKPDMVILDVILPTIKGREVCRRLKAMEVSANIPVMFLTAKDSEDDIEAEMSLGAITHVNKPINSMALLREIKKILGGG